MLGGTADLLVLAMAFLLGSIPLYVLAGQPQTGPAAEGAMETYLLGALLGIVLMAGVTALLGVGGGRRRTRRSPPRWRVRRPVR